MPLGDWTTKTPYTAQELYYDPVSKLLFANRDGLFHVYKQTMYRVSWLQETNSTRTSLPDTAVFKQ
eukprot:4746797-Ditylum_brightwellii.AAC.1